MQITVLILASVLLLAGCSTIKVDNTGSNTIAPICVSGGKIADTTIVWSTLWRPDQKEPQLRESMAKKGINRFVEETECINAVSIHQVEINQNTPSNTEIIEVSKEMKVDQVLFIVIRELGPTLEIGIPAIITGHTEVVLEAKLINLSSKSIINDSKVHWREGGMFVIKGTSSLSEDLSSALASILTAPES